MRGLDDRPRPDPTKPARRMNLSDLADCIFRIPEVEDGFVQQTEDMGRNDFAPVSGAVQARSLKYERKQSFRVVIRSKNKTHEGRSNSVKMATVDALKSIGIDLDKSIAGVVNSAPASDRERWKKTQADCDETIKMLQKLKAWLA